MSCTGEAGGSEREGILRVAHGAQAARAGARFRVRLHGRIAYHMEIQVVVGGPHDQGTTIACLLRIPSHSFPILPPAPARSTFSFPQPATPITANMLSHSLL